MDIKHYRLFINNQWQAPLTDEWLDSINPYTNKVWAKIPRAGADDAKLACEAANAAFQTWSQTHPSVRGEYLRRLGALIREHADHLAVVESTDNGKLLNEMKTQLNYLPKFYDYYAGLADKIMGNTIPVDKPEHVAYTEYEPLGVVVAITAWNSPLMLLTWKLAPALAAGNTIIIKPSEYASASAFEFAKLVEAAGFPPGVINIVSGLGSEVGPALISHPLVAKVTFTGGTQTGIAVHSLAAQHSKKVTLELGGKSPNIVFADANLENAVKGVISGIFAASGQTCIAGSRLLLEESIYDSFVEKLTTFAKQARLGDPMQADTQVGPVATPPQFEKIIDYLSIAKQEGAQCVLGGKAARGGNCGDSPWFVEPTVFTQVNNQMRIAQEEVFGPVLSVIKFKDAEEAIHIANDIKFGLAAGVWTQDMKKALLLPKRIKAGTVWVNTYRSVSYLVPFGGYKQSGIGRENGWDAIYDYLQIKSTWINLANEIQNPFVIK